MELQDTINLRRTVRDWSDEKVPPEVIRKALEAGLKAPSYNHQKEWDFILVKDPSARRAIVEAEKLPDEVSDQFREALKKYEALAQEVYFYAIPKQKQMLLSAPELLLVVYKPKTQINQSKRVADLNCHAAVWACIENILLTFAENNIFGTTVIPEQTPGVKKALGIPQELEIAVMIPFGYKAANAKIIPPKEVKLDTKLHTDNW